MGKTKNERLTKTSSRYYDRKSGGFSIKEAWNSIPELFNLGVGNIKTQDRSRRRKRSTRKNDNRRKMIIALKRRNRN